MRFKRGARTPDRAQFEDQETIQWIVSLRTGGLNSKLHVLADADGCPIRMFLSAGQTSDCIGAWALLPSIPQAAALLGDRGYDADRFRKALIEWGVSPCIPSRSGRKVPIPHDAHLYRQRHKIENMFARLKDWRRIATRYNRSPILFLLACALSATVSIGCESCTLDGLRHAINKQEQVKRMG